MLTVVFGCDSSGTRRMRKPLASWYSLTPSTLDSSSRAFGGGAGAGAATVGGIGAVGGAATTPAGPDLQAATPMASARSERLMSIPFGSEIVADADTGIQVDGIGVG